MRKLYRTLYRTPIFSRFSAIFDVISFDKLKLLLLIWQYIEIIIITIL